MIDNPTPEVSRDDPNDPASPVLTTAAAAQFLGMPPHKLQRMRWQGRGPAHVKTGFYCAYFKSDLLAWLESLRTPGEVEGSARDQSPSQNGVGA